MKIYKTCRTLIMWRFYEVLETGSYVYLIKDYESYIDEDKKGNLKQVNVTKEIQEQLNEAWENIFNQYVELKDEREIRIIFKKRAYISKLETKLSICSNLLKCLSVQTDEKMRLKSIKELSAWGYPINRNKPLDEEIERVTRNLKSLQSGINIKKSEFERDYKNELRNEKVSISKQIANIEAVLDKDFIDDRKISVERWIAYVNQAERKAKLLNKKSA